MTRLKIVIDTALFFVVAMAFGVIEGSGHVKWGMPNFGPFIAEWHTPMAVIMLATAWLSGCLVHIPAWVLLEDMTYWVASRWIWAGPELLPESWVSMSLGGVVVPLFNAYLPFTYLLLFVAWVVILVWRKTRVKH